MTNNEEATKEAASKIRPFAAHAYGRLTTRAGIQYLYDRAYLPFALKRPGSAPEPFEDRWPEDVIEEICFGDERERTRHAPPVRDPWTEETGWYEGRWRNRPPRSKKGSVK
jgi:hypothetical protein